MKKNIIITILIILILGIGIGYSILESDLGINVVFHGKRQVCENITSLYKRLRCSSVRDDTSSTYVTSSSGIDLNSAPSSTNGQGLYLRSSTYNDDYPILYYRGDVSNNNVSFAGFCWKIVRTTSTGGVKLIYNGVVGSDGSCSNTGASSALSDLSAFNEINTSPADVGYMYGERYVYRSRSMSSDTNSYYYGNDVTYDASSNTYKLSGDTITSSNWSNDRLTLASKYHYTCFSNTTDCGSTVNYISYFGNSSRVYYIALVGGDKLESALEKMFTNTTNSTIKNAIDSWYVANLVNYSDRLEDTVWCNDRTFYSGSLEGKDTDAHDTYSRFWPYGNNADSSNPSLVCPNSRDSFTTSTDNGNGALTYPIGLLTTDEATLAGSGWNGSSKTAYLNAGQEFWLMSPYHFGYASGRIFSIHPEGYLYGRPTGNTYGVRPSISLKNGISISGGDGSSTSPLKID